MSERTLLEIDHEIRELKKFLFLLLQDRGEAPSGGWPELDADDSVMLAFENPEDADEAMLYPAKQVQDAVMKLYAERTSFLLAIPQRYLEPGGSFEVPNWNSRHLPRRQWVRSLYKQIRPEFDSNDSCYREVAFLYNAEFEDYLIELYYETHSGEDVSISPETVCNYVKDLKKM